MDLVQMTIVGILMAGVAIGSVIWLFATMTTVSVERLARMMKRIGLGPMKHQLSAATGKELRRRCRRCTREALCERWLAGEVDGDNTFCANAELFRNLAVIRTPL